MIAPKNVAVFFVCVLYVKFILIPKNEVRIVFKKQLVYDFLC